MILLVRLGLGADVGESSGYAIVFSVSLMILMLRFRARGRGR